MNNTKHLLTKYVNEVRQQQNYKTSYLKLAKNDIPHSSKLRILKTLGITQREAKEIMESESLEETEKYFLHHNTEAGKKFREIFSEKYEEEAIEVFLREMSFIVTFYSKIELMPSKKDLKATKSSVKKIKANLSDLDKKVWQIRSRNEWCYIHDLFIKKYKELRKEHSGEDHDIIPANIAGFFDGIRAASHVFNLLDIDSLITEHDAKGREQSSRNMALLALAESFEICFGKKPTSTILVRKDRPCFHYCVNLFLEKITLDSDDYINSEDLLKMIIGVYDEKEKLL